MGDTDLIASMAKRLGTLEKSLRECSGQLARAHADNEALKSKVGGRVGRAGALLA